MLSLALLGGSVLAAKLPSAGAAAPGCPCVVLIEVDGLEPKDVTREATPFLWELAHPDEGQLLNETERAGWTWQAPRAVMSAGTAANSAALLTAAYPEQNGVAADDFLDPDGRTTTVRLEKSPEVLEEDTMQLDYTAHYDSKSLLEILPSETDGSKQAAAFVGNPALSGIVDVIDTPALKWWPTNDDPQNPPSPAYCDAPRQAPDDPQAYDPPCSAADIVTLDRALTSLQDSGEKVSFTYVHLAELGVIKRRDGDYSPATPPTEANSPAAEQSLPRALGQLDTAIAQFVSRYNDDVNSPETAGKWDDTFFMVVGSHGYETAPQPNRLPAPDGESDLETYVEADGRFKYSPYGSMAAIHSTASDPAARRAAIREMADKFNPDGGEIAQACAQMIAVTPPPCIKEVLYARSDVAPPELLSADLETRRKHLLWEAHPDWHFDHISQEEPPGPSGASGDLLIVTEPGWGTARAIPAQQGTNDPPLSDAPDPYLGVAGGPRNRAVAAIVNGPNNDQGVRQVVPDFYPAREIEDEGVLVADPQDTRYGSLAAANADPTDDTEVDGHERQPENVDFAPTIAALLGVPIGDEQLAGRFLQEAFTRDLAFPDFDPPPPPEPDPVVVEEIIPEPQPEVIILPPPPTPDPPPPPKGWDYRGIVRNLRAAVGDKRGRIFPRVPARADLSYLIMRADFGKPLASVKLSFYRRQRTTVRSGARRTVVKTLASFDPFSIRRAKNAKLTLKVPKAFKPTHVGVIVRQARRLTGREARIARRKRRPLFRAYGARVGGIFAIKNAGRLHTLAPKRRTRRRG